jgi:Tfp pilus assembly protein PilV
MPGHVFFVRARARSRCAGLTLVEFLFATSIMAFVALGVAGMFPAALRSVMVGGFTTKATALAQQMADAVRTDAMRIEGFNALISTYNGVSTSSVSANCSNPTLLTPLQKWGCDITVTMATTTGQGLPAGVGTIAVTCVNPNGTVNTTNPCPTDLRRVTVTVTWDRTGSRTVSVVTNVARPN